MDTVPIHVTACDHCFQPKYQAHVLKFLVVTSHTGFILFVSSSYTGACSDEHMPTHSGVTALLLQEGWKLLADGDFHSENLIIPFTATQVFPMRLSPGQTEAQYKTERDAKIEHNTVQAHFRSRVEHAYGVGKVGNFFKAQFGGSHVTLNQLFTLVCAAVNMRLEDSFPEGFYALDHLEMKFARSRKVVLARKTFASKIDYVPLPPLEPVKRGADDGPRATQAPQARAPRALPARPAPQPAHLNAGLVNAALGEIKRHFHRKKVK